MEFFSEYKRKLIDKIVEHNFDSTILIFIPLIFPHLPILINSLQFLLYMYQGFKVGNMHLT